ncbi:MAG: hypothetical protein JXX29_20630 [Deltaproteobacteria bacterium]|nr:hypothetical protein [Deltaproteobacteria bacterium]MBN2674099.1 hypothetical protein [Deltaproteobacteria bacterium]
MRNYLAMWVMIIGTVALIGCDDNSDDSGNPCVEMLPYFEQAMETVCPSYEGCTYCGEIDYALVEQQECTGQAREEAEMVLDDPEGMMPSLEYTIQVLCEEEASSE